MVSRLWVRLLLAALAATLCAGLRAEPVPAAGHNFFVGADEDALLWGNPQQTASIARSLGLRSLRITLQWHAGDTKVSALDQRQLDRLQLEVGGLRVVAGVYGKAADAPVTPPARAAFCGYVTDLLRDNPEIDDVVIWNDPNDGAFWMPQFNADGSSAAPAAYEALLADCWDAAHAVRPAANVVSAAVSKSSTAKGGFTLAWHPPGAWIAKVAASYRASGRAKPIFDTFGYVPHPTGSNERPWTRHPGFSAISIGDYDVLMRTLAAGFQGTAQPIPGQGSTTIWYLAQGYQTVPDQSKAALYTGTETDPDPVPAWSPQEGADPGAGDGPDQAIQLADAITIAYCQPNVGAYFNFHLTDERDLAGWQSGVYWADGTPKPAYQALHRAAADANAGSINCAAFSATGVPPRPPAVQQVLAQLQVSNLRMSALSAFGGTLAWQTTNPAQVQVSYGLADYGVPTIWAPVGSTGNAQTAALTGLDSNTTYRVWVTAVGDDGQRAQATFDVTTPGRPSSPQATLGKPNGSVLLNGQPFFPMIVYSICPYQYGAALTSGINLFALNACGTLQAQLNALGGAAYSTAVAGGAFASGPGLIGWFHMDEPDGSDVPASALPGPPSGVGGLSFLTLTNHFYSGAAPLAWGRGMYPGLIAKADVIGFDLYPLQEWCRPNHLYDVLLAQRELVQLAGDKPTFQWIEADNWNCPGGATAVTPATVRAESWLAIAGGAHGLGFWPAEWSSAVGRTIAGIERDVARLGPAIYAPSQSAGDNNNRVWVSARTWAGAQYVFAVNSSYTAANAKITIPGLNGRSLNVMGEGRRINTDDNSFTDHFPPLAVHVYVAPPAG